MTVEFDLTEGEALKAVGMAAAASARYRELLVARKIAKYLASKSPTRTCDADMVQKFLIEKGIKLGNAAGSIFERKHWEFTGRIRKSKRVSNHSRLVRVWRLKDA